MSPHRDERHQYANLLNKKAYNTKKSRGSLDKYSSQGSKQLNKSVNSINPSVQSKKSNLNKSMASTSEHAFKSSQKSVHQLLMQKLNGSQPPSIHQTPAQNYCISLGQQYTFASSNQYENENESKRQTEQKTPVKFGQTKYGGYSEIMELSPPSTEKPKSLLL